MIVRAAPPEHYGFLCDRLGLSLSVGFRAIEALDAQGEVRGMVGYDGWTPASVQAHMAVDTPIAWRSLLRPAFAYPFEEAGRSVIFGTIRASNARSLRMVRALGFQKLTSLRDGYAVGEDLLVFEMRKENCRWLKPHRKAA